MKEFEIYFEGAGAEIRKQAVSRKDFENILHTFDTEGLESTLEAFCNGGASYSKTLFHNRGCDIGAWLTVDGKVIALSGVNLTQLDDLTELTGFPEGGGLSFYFSHSEKASLTGKVRSRRSFNPALLELEYIEYEICASAPNMNYGRYGDIITDVIYDGEKVETEYDDCGGEINCLLLIPKDREGDVKEMIAVLYPDYEQDTHAFDAETLRRYLQAK